MKYFKKLLLLLTIPILYNCTGKDHTNSATADEKALIATINEFNDAFRTGNSTALETMITDNYQHTNGNSKAIDKATWIAYLQKRKQRIVAGELTVTDYKMDQTKVKLYGDTAIVTARIQVSETQSGEHTQKSFRVTHVWVNEAGHWKRAGFHDTKIQ